MRFPNNASLKENGNWLFQYCSNLKSVNIPDTVTTIGAMFYQCRKLENITIPNSVTKIYDNAFYECSSLTSVEIPSGVTLIGANALYIGSSMNKSTIRMLPITPPVIRSNTFGAKYLNKIIVPKGTGNVYKSATNWSAYADYIEEATE